MPKKNAMKAAALPIIERGERLYTQVNWAQSYVSLLLGLIIVFFFGTVLVFSVWHHKKGLLPTLPSAKSKTSLKINVYEQTDSFMSRFRFVQSLTLPKRKTEQGILSDHAYVVKAGDDLWDIAVQEYGDGTRWVDIANTNNLSNPDSIDEGMTLTIPH